MPPEIKRDTFLHTNSDKNNHKDNEDNESKTHQHPGFQREDAAVRVNVLRKRINSTGGNTKHETRHTPSVAHELNKMRGGDYRGVQEDRSHSPSFCATDPPTSEVSRECAPRQSLESIEAECKERHWRMYLPDGQYAGEMSGKAEKTLEVGLCVTQRCEGSPPLTSIPLDALRWTSRRAELHICGVNWRS